MPFLEFSGPKAFLPLCGPSTPEGFWTDPLGPGTGAVAISDVRTDTGTQSPGATSGRGPRWFPCRAGARPGRSDQGPAGSPTPPSGPLGRGPRVPPTSPKRCRCCPLGTPTFRVECALCARSPATSTTFLLIPRMSPGFLLLSPSTAGSPPVYTQFIHSGGSPAPPPAGHRLRA